MIIGVDPHKSTHTASAVDAAMNTAVASMRVAASAAGYRRLREDLQPDSPHRTPPVPAHPPAS